MTAPLLAVDAPRSSTAPSSRCPGRSPAPTAGPSTRCSARPTVLQAVERHAPRAVVLCFGAEAAAYRVEPTRPTTPTARRCPTSSREQWEAAPAFFGAFGWPTLTAGDARGRRPPRRAGARRGRRGRRGAAVHRRPRHVPVRRGARPVLFPRGGQGRARGHRRPTRSGGATASSPRRSRTSSPCAATRRTACRAPGASARRPRASCCATTATLDGAARDGRHRAPRLRPERRPDAARPGRRAADLPRHRDAARRRRRAPARRPTDFAGAAAAAREHGMRRLSQRLEALAR